MNMLRSASEWITQQRGRFLSENIVYRHFGDDETVLQISATRGRTIFKAENDYGVTIRVFSIDFLVEAELLPFSPKKGDEIICDGKIFEVLAPNDEPVFRWSGQFEHTLRIHTKEIGDAD